MFLLAVVQCFIACWALLVEKFVPAEREKKIVKIRGRLPTSDHRSINASNLRKLTLHTLQNKLPNSSIITKKLPYTCIIQL